jgi:hypothetical protein
VTATLLRKVWLKFVRGFVGLFGLDVCPTQPVPARPETAEQRARRARLAGLLRPGPPAAGRPTDAERRERHENPARLT